MRRLRAIKPRLTGRSRGRLRLAYGLRSERRVIPLRRAVKENFSARPVSRDRLKGNDERRTEGKLSFSSSFRVPRSAFPLRLRADFRDGAAHALVDADDGVYLLLGLRVVGVVLEHLAQVCERVLVEARLPGRPVDVGAREVGVGCGLLVGGGRAGRFRLLGGLLDARVKLRRVGERTIRAAVGSRGRGSAAAAVRGDDAGRARRVRTA